MIKNSGKYSYRMAGGRGGRCHGRRVQHQRVQDGAEAQPALQSTQVRYMGKRIKRKTLYIQFTLKVTQSYVANKTANGLIKA